MAETQSGSLKGLTLGGAVAAVVVALGLWLGGVFDPFGALDDAESGETVATEAAGGTSGGTAETAAATAPKVAETASSDTAAPAPSETAEAATSDQGASEATAETTTEAAAETVTTGDTATDTAAATTEAPATDSATAEAGTETATSGDAAATGETTATAAAPATEAPATTEETTTASDAPAGDATTATADTATGTTGGATTQTAGDTASATTTASATETGAVTGTQPATEPASAETAATDTAATDTATAAADDKAPKFDVVRMETDGAALVAGAAEPGSKVQVLVDGQVVSEETAGGDGKFVAFVDLPKSDATRVVTLRSSGGAGEMASTQEVILGPNPGATSDAATASADGTVQTAAAAPTVLLSDKDGVKVLQAPGNGSDGDVSIGAISYSDSGAVRIAGLGAAGGFVRAYLDGALLTEGQIGADGNWTLDLPEVAEGDHTLRIDELAADGTVRSRVETPFAGQPEAEVQTASASAAVTSGTTVPSDAVATTQAPAASGATTTAASGQPVASITQVTVERGSTLWAIAREKYGEGLMYVRVFEANKGLIRNPDLIYPGQVFNLPD